MGCRQVYSIGHSNRRLGELVQLLKRYNVRLLVDVRSRPGSKHMPWFSKKILEEQLPRRGVAYVWLGDLLGGLREQPYTEYMKTMEYRRGIAVLVALIESSKSNVAFMCRERYWLNCHRAYIAETLHRLGYTVQHIIDVGHVEKHKPLGIGVEWIKPLHACRL